MTGFCKRLLIKIYSPQRRGGHGDFEQKRVNLSDLCVSVVKIKLFSMSCYSLLGTNYLSERDH
jgi:hypothetical protein